MDKTINRKEYWDKLMELSRSRPKLSLGCFEQGLASLQDKRKNEAKTNKIAEPGVKSENEMILRMRVRVRLKWLATSLDCAVML